MSFFSSVTAKKARESVRRKRWACALLELFFSRLFFSSLFSVLTCSLQSANAREYIFGGRSELGGAAERKREMRALRAAGGDEVAGNDDADADDEEFDFGIDKGILLLLAPEAPPCARTQKLGGTPREVLRGAKAPLEPWWAAIGSCVWQDETFSSF